MCERDSGGGGVAKYFFFMFVLCVKVRGWWIKYEEENTAWSLVRVWKLVMYVYKHTHTCKQNTYT